MNQTELDWLGYTAQELIGRKHFVELIALDRVERFKEQFAIVMKQGHVNGLEFDIVKKNGAQFPVILSATAVSDAEGHLYPAALHLWISPTVNGRMTCFA